MTQEARGQLLAWLGGVEDKVGVACEPFSQWVIEDRFPRGDRLGKRSAPNW